MKCLLCQEKEANQTGAHIFTSSLVKSCLNVEGKTGRDDELIFSFSQSGEIKDYLNENEFVFRVISNDKRLEINKDIISNEFATNESQRLKNRVISKYHELTGEKITQKKLDLFKDVFFDYENVPIAQRWTEERFNRILNAVIEDD